MLLGSSPGAVPDVRRAALADRQHSPAHPDHRTYEVAPKKNKRGKNMKIETGMKKEVFVNGRKHSIEVINRKDEEYCYALTISIDNMLTVEGIDIQRSPSGEEYFLFPRYLTDDTVFVSFI